MEYPGPPRDGADRSSSDQDGLQASNISECSLKSLSPPALLSELNRGQPARFRASDVPHARSFLQGIDDDDDLATTELAADAVVGYGAGAAAAGLAAAS